MSVAEIAVETLSASDLIERTLHRRAVEAVIWGMPVVNYDLMLQEMLTKTAGKVNQVIYWGRPLDWHNQTLTPNPDTLYFMAFFNTKDAGPIVIDVPPDRSAKCAGRAGPVGHGLRSGDARAHQERRSRQPSVEQHRSEEKRRRISRFVFRSEGTRGQRAELGTYGSGAQVRADGALLRADQGALREGVETP